MREDDDTSQLSQWRFGEYLHISNEVGLSYFRSKDEGSRSLCLALDTEYIGEPPAEDANFNPFIEAVNVPIESLASVRSI